MHQVRWSGQIASTDPPFTAHINLRPAIAPNDDHSEARQPLRQSHLVDEALQFRRDFAISWLQRRQSAAGEQNGRYGTEQPNTDTLRPTTLVAIAGSVGGMPR
jgi:hypothetical protein